MTYALDFPAIAISCFTQFLFQHPDTLIELPDLIRIGNLACIREPVSILMTQEKPVVTDRHQYLGSIAPSKRRKIIDVVTWIPFPCNLQILCNEAS